MTGAAAAPAAQGQPRQPSPRRWRWIALALLAVALLLALALRVALRPEHVTGVLLQQVGKVLGLEITASGVGEYHVRGTPTLVVRGVVARAPGAETPVLRAERVLISLPWSTVRSRGADLAITRIELDAPVIDIGAVQQWLASRPPSDTRLPTLSDGLVVGDGRVVGSGWSVEGLELRLPRLHPERPLAATLSGRFVAAAARADFGLALAMTRPGNGAGFAVAGPVTIDGRDWRLAGKLKLSGPLRFGGGALALRPARLGLGAKYVAGATALAFQLGAQGTLRHAAGTTSLGPAAVALRGEGPVPDLDARGAIALGQRLVLRLQGRLQAWPQAWPALPPPIGQSTSALPFALDYLGKSDLSAPADLHLERDRTVLDARFRLRDVTTWLAAPTGGSPLPPLAGRLQSPRLDVAGAQLEGVEVVFEDPNLPAVTP